jgi:FKBP-type peptidyl-prolyl cis-trans isomerase FklB
MTIKPLALVIYLVFLNGCSMAPTNITASNNNKTKSIDTSISTSTQSSYALGLLKVQALRNINYPINREEYEQGLRDALAGKTATELPSAQDWQALAELGYNEVKSVNLAAGKAFLAQNKAKPGVVTLPSGVQYQVLKEGKGDKPRLKDTVGILYTIRGIDDKVKVDNMVKGKAKMYEIALKKMISKGWQEALLLMPQGSKWRLFIPGELAFGEKGLSEKGILPNETLVIDTYLLAVK